MWLDCYAILITAFIYEGKNPNYMFYFLFSLKNIFRRETFLKNFFFHLRHCFSYGF